MPSSSGYKYLLGLSLSSAGNYAEALTALREAASLDPADIRPHLLLAGDLDSLNRHNEAEAEWRRALAIDAGSAMALEGLSQELIDRKDFASVVRLLDRPSSQGLRTSRQSLNLGIAYAGLVQLDNAVHVLREGLNADPGRCRPQTNWP